MYNARNSGQQLAVVFLDMRKAFDTVDHLILPHNLESFNLGGNFIKCLRFYLVDRQQQTKANDCISTSLPTMSRM